MQQQSTGRYVLLFGDEELSGHATAAPDASGQLGVAKPLAGAAAAQAGAGGALTVDDPAAVDPSSLGMALAGLRHDAIVELFELDATPVGGSVLYFHNGSNELNAAVVWQGLTYQRYPIEVTGFATSSSGPQRRPMLRVSNVLGLIGVLIRQYQGLKGARLTRRRTLARYLDAVNFAAGNVHADPTAHYPDDVHELDRQARRNKVVVEYEVANPLDMHQVPLPRRQVIASFCPSMYRSADCGYTGPAVAKEDDTPTALLAEDRCGHRLASCRLRQWPAGELGFGGFPGAGVTRNV